MNTAVVKMLEKLFKRSTIFKFGFKFNSAYSRSTGQVYFVSDDLQTVKVKIPLNYKNRNYKGTMFGGAMCSATDPIYMIQLIAILGEQYVVWDKSSSIRFRKPGNQTLYAEFKISDELLREIKKDIEEHHKKDYSLKVNLTDKENRVYAEIERVVYIASKEYHLNKRGIKN